MGSVHTRMRLSHVRMCLRLHMLQLNFFLQPSIEHVTLVVKALQSFEQNLVAVHPPQ